MASMRSASIARSRRDFFIVGHRGRLFHGFLPASHQDSVDLQRRFDSRLRPVAGQADAIDDSATDHNRLPVLQRVVSLRHGHSQYGSDFFCLIPFPAGDGHAPDPRDPPILFLRITGQIGHHGGDDIRGLLRMIGNQLLARVGWQPVVEQLPSDLYSVSRGYDSSRLRRRETCRLGSNGHEMNATQVE